MDSEREDGEIVDEFDEVSDDSISLDIPAGKSPQNVISVCSSDYGTSPPKTHATYQVGPQTFPRSPIKRRKSIELKRKRRKSFLYRDSSSSDDEQRPKMAKRLNTAVRIKGTEEKPYNLKKCINTMINCENKTENDNILKKLQTTTPTDNSAKTTESARLDTVKSRPTKSPRTVDATSVNNTKTSINSAKTSDNRKRIANSDKSKHSPVSLLDMGTVETISSSDCSENEHDILKLRKTALLSTLKDNSSTSINNTNTSIDNTNTSINCTNTAIDNTSVATDNTNTAIDTSIDNNTGSVTITNDPMDLESSSDDSKELTQDTELQELRMAALKTAIFQKASKRKLRKEMLLKSETNKENAQDNLNVHDTGSAQSKNENLVEITTENNNVDDLVENFIEHGTESPEKFTTPTKDAVGSTEIKVQTPEEDLDIMRACLLASISHKITSTSKPASPSATAVNAATEVPTAKIPVPPKQTIKIPVVSVNVRNQERSVKTISCAQLQIPKVKPLIIQVNADSESDHFTDLSDHEEQDSVSSKIEDFLKTTRAQFEQELKTRHSDGNIQAAASKNITAVQSNNKQCLVRSKTVTNVATYKNTSKTALKVLNTAQKVTLDAKILKAATENTVKAKQTILSKLPVVHTTYALRKPNVSKNPYQKVLNTKATTVTNSVSNNNNNKTTNIVALNQQKNLIAANKKMIGNSTNLVTIVNSKNKKINKVNCSKNTITAADVVKNATKNAVVANVQNTNDVIISDDDVFKNMIKPSDILKMATKSDNTKQNKSTVNESSDLSARNLIKPSDILVNSNAKENTARQAENVNAVKDKTKNILESITQKTRQFLLGDDVIESNNIENEILVAKCNVSESANMNLQENVSELRHIEKPSNNFLDLTKDLKNKNIVIVENTDSFPSFISKKRCSMPLEKNAVKQDAKRRKTGFIIHSENVGLDNYLNMVGKSHNLKKSRISRPNLQVTVKNDNLLYADLIKKAKALAEVTVKKENAAKANVNKRKAKTDAVSIGDKLYGNFVSKITAENDTANTATIVNNLTIIVNEKTTENIADNLVEKSSKTNLESTSVNKTQENTSKNENITQTNIENSKKEHDKIKTEISEISDSIVQEIVENAMDIAQNKIIVNTMTNIVQCETSESNTCKNDSSNENVVYNTNVAVQANIQHENINENTVSGTNIHNTQENSQMENVNTNIISSSNLEALINVQENTKNINNAIVTGTNTESAINGIDGQNIDKNIVVSGTNTELQINIQENSQNIEKNINTETQQQQNIQQNTQKTTENIHQHIETIVPITEEEENIVNVKENQENIELHTNEFEEKDNYNDSIMESTDVAKRTDNDTKENEKEVDKTSNLLEEIEDENVKNVENNSKNHENVVVDNVTEVCNNKNAVNIQELEGTSSENQCNKVQTKITSNNENKNNATNIIVAEQHTQVVEDKQLNNVDKVVNNEIIATTNNNNNPSVSSIGNEENLEENIEELNNKASKVDNNTTTIINNEIENITMSKNVTEQLKNNIVNNANKMSTSVLDSTEKKKETTTTKNTTNCDLETNTTICKEENINQDAEITEHVKINNETNIKNKEILCTVVTTENVQEHRHEESSKEMDKEKDNIQSAMVIKSKNIHEQHENNTIITQNTKVAEVNISTNDIKTEEDDTKKQPIKRNFLRVRTDIFKNVDVVDLTSENEENVQEDDENIIVIDDKMKSCENTMENSGKDNRKTTSKYKGSDKTSINNTKTASRKDPKTISTSKSVDKNSSGNKNIVETSRKDTQTISTSKSVDKNSSGNKNIVETARKDTQTISTSKSVDKNSSGNKNIVETSRNDTQPISTSKSIDKNSSTNKHIVEASRKDIQTISASKNVDKNISGNKNIVEASRKDTQTISTSKSIDTNASTNKNIDKTMVKDTPTTSTTKNSDNTSRKDSQTTSTNKNVDKTVRNSFKIDEINTKKLPEKATSTTTSVNSSNVKDRQNLGSKTALNGQSSFESSKNKSCISNFSFIQQFNSISSSIRKSQEKSFLNASVKKNVSSSPLLRESSDLNSSLDSSFNKSLVKFMPKSKAEEYKRLKLKIKNAKHKSKLQNAVQSNEEDVRKNQETTPEPSTTVDNIRCESALVTPTSLEESKRNVKNCQDKVIRLVRELKEAKLELDNAKRERDRILDIEKMKSAKATPTSKTIEKNDSIVTSTTTTNNDSNTNAKKTENLLKNNSTACSSTDDEVSSVTKNVSSDKVILSDSLQDSNVTVKDKSTEIEKNCSETPIAVVNGAENECKPSNFEEYVSPIVNWNRVTCQMDPHATLCPFQLFGECKDKECRFSHT